MSIYATLWEIKVPRQHCFDNQWVTVYAQAVPPHIGHPSCYPDGDPYGAFLPPVVQDYDPESGIEKVNRAVVIVQEGRDEKEGQRYVNPLMILTGKEYATITFADLLERIHRAIGWDENVVGQWISPSGQKKIIRREI